MSLRDVAMNNFERDQARGGVGIFESIGCYQSTDLQCDERSQVWGYKVPSKPDLYTVREQYGNVNNKSQCAAVYSKAQL